MIDYKLLDQSINYYNSLGFKRIETPWMVSEYIDHLTKPKDVPAFVIDVNNKHLVASGEQSFLELYLKRYLPEGKFMTVTPCFRYEKRDDLHCKTFMKNELIITDDVSEKSLNELVQLAKLFYELYIPNCVIVKTDIGFDIEIDGYELGSYGIRECGFLKWIYGTACAEPRFSRLIKKYSKI